MMFPWRYSQFILGTHWDNYLTRYQKYRHNSVLCIAPLCLYNCFPPSRHTFNQLLTHLWLYSIPHLCHSLPNLPNSCCWCFILAQLQFDMMPGVFNGIKVWGLCCPV